MGGPDPHPAGAPSPAAGLGYRPVASRRFQGADRNRLRLICVSDTHLVPRELPYADDAPKALHALLVAYSDYAIFLLGDIIESLPLTSAQLKDTPRSPRLRPLFNCIRARDDVHVVPGNHDHRGQRILRALVARERFHAQGTRLGRLALVHGHEGSVGPSRLSSYFGALPTAVAVTAHRLGVPFPNLETNGEIARRLRGINDYIVFGHTHEPEVRPTYANTGCFLRRGRQTFIEIAQGKITLWGRAARG